MNPDEAEVGRIVGGLRVADGSGVVNIEAHLGTHDQDVWSALTDPRRLGLWLGELEGPLRLGSEVQARFAATGWEATLLTEVCDPARRLLISTRSPDEPDCLIEVTLIAKGGQTIVVFQDRGLPLEHLAAYGAGDQVLVEDLAAHLAGLGRCDARARWQELHPQYTVYAEGLV